MIAATLVLALIAALALAEERERVDDLVTAQEVLLVCEQTPVTRSVDPNPPILGAKRWSWDDWVEYEDKVAMERLRARYVSLDKPPAPRTAHRKKVS